MDNKRVKIYKSATDVSLLDILDYLNYHTLNTKKELIYKGNLKFVVNEFGTSRNQVSARLSKANAKVLFHSIANHLFPNLYPNGFSEFGKSYNQNNQLRVRVIHFDYEKEKHRYKIQIDEGPGNHTGMTKRDKSARTYIEYSEALKMAHEVIDYIRTAEFIAHMKDKPYYTIVQDYEPAKDKHLSDVRLHTNSFQNEEPYIIKLGNLTGRDINSLDTHSLETLLANLTPDTPEIEELLMEVKKVLARRY